MRESELPTFEEMRQRAGVLLRDTLDELRSDWRSGTGPTREQAQAATDAKAAIAQAIGHLDRAGR